MSAGAGNAVAVIDPRGQRFAAALTTLVLATVLLTGSAWLLLAQTAVFAVGVLAGPARTPYAWLYRRALRPRLGPPREMEDAAPPRFAQLCGLLFGALGLIGVALGASLLTTVAVALALGAAFLNAAFGFCLGCEIYLLARRAGIRLPLST
jgi:Ca2+/Na+ antiporter